MKNHIIYDKAFLLMNCPYSRVDVQVVINSSVVIGCSCLYRISQVLIWFHKRKLNEVNNVFKLYKHSIRFYSHSYQHCGKNYKMSNHCFICTRGVYRNSKAMECDDCQRRCHIKCGINIFNEDSNLVFEGNIHMIYWLLFND